VSLYPNYADIPSLAVSGSKLRILELLLLCLLLCRLGAFQLSLKAASGPPDPASAGDTISGARRGQLIGLFGLRLRCPGLGRQEKRNARCSTGAGRFCISIILCFLVCCPDALKLSLKAASGPPDPAAAGDNIGGSTPRTVDQFICPSSSLPGRGGKRSGMLD
jgi:hypothetical protein